MVDGESEVSRATEVQVMGKVQSYRDLEVYRLAFDLAIEVDVMSKALPKHELYETGSQIRRSAKSIPANIAEGYGRRRYKKDYVRFLVCALASCDETRVHLDMLNATGSLQDSDHQGLTQRYNLLGKKLNRFLQAVIQHHKEPYR
jgi:four helix bundle protein